MTHRRFLTFTLRCEVAVPTCHTYKVRIVAQPHEAVSEIHGLVLHYVHTDLLILCLSTCEQTRFTETLHPKGSSGKHHETLTQVVLASNVSHDGVALNDLPVSVLQVWKLQRHNHTEEYTTQPVTKILESDPFTHVGKVHSKLVFFIKPAAFVIIWR